MSARPAVVFALACAIGAGAAGAGCTGERTEVSPRRATLESLIDHVFMPMLETFEQGSERLQQQAELFCEAPDAESLAATRASFHPARPANIEEVLEGDAVSYTTSPSPRD